MWDVFATSIVILVSAFVTGATRRLWSTDEWRHIQLSFGATQIAGALFIFVAHVVYPGADFDLFHESAVQVTDEVRMSPGALFHVFRLVFQQEHSLGTYVVLSGTSTGTMVGLMALSHLLTLDSLWATSFLFAQISMAGRVLIYLAMREAFLPAHHRTVRLASLFVPSVVWWSAGVVKEGVALFGLGLFVFGAGRVVLKRPSAVAMACAFCGACIVFLVKAYVILTAAIAIAVYLYWDGVARHGRGVSVLTLTLAAATLYLAVGVVGSLNSRFNVSSLVDETARMQQAGTTVSGGSNYTLGAGENASLMRQLLLAPLGMFTGLFRPGLWEARNPMMLANATETTVILWFTSTVMAERNLTRRLAEYFRSTPFGMFALVFALLLGTGTGLASANLGTLSRYRMPMMPFFAAMLFTLRAHFATSVAPTRFGETRPRAGRRSSPTG